MQDGQRNPAEGPPGTQDTFQLIAEHSPNMAFINQHGRVVYANHKCTEVMGYTRKEFLSADFDFMCLIAPESIERFREAYERHQAGGGSEKFEYALVTKDGRRIDTLMESRRITYRGEPAILGSITDITEQKQAEESLRYRLALDSLIARISRRFIDIATADVDAAIVEALGEVSRFTGAAVGSIFLFSEDRLHASNFYEWCADPAESMRAVQQDVPSDLFGYYWEIIRRHQPVIVRRPDDLPAEARGERDYNLEHGFRPVMVIPMILEGEFYGALVLFGPLGQDQDWREEAVELLLVFADTLVSALERKRVEGVLQASEERYRTVSELTSDYSYGHRVGPDGELVNEWATGALVKITGYQPGELEERGGWPALIHPDDIELARSQLKALMAGNAATIEYRIVTKSGDERWMRDYARPVWDAAAGRAVRIYGAVQDITERRHAHADVLSRERFLSSVFSSIKDGISVLDRDYNVIRVNPAMEEWYAHAMPLVGKKCYQVYHGRAERCEVCPTFDTLKTREPCYEVVPKVGPEGEVTGWIDLYTHPLFDAQTGELTGVIEYVRDITERKKLEEQFLVSQKMESVGRLAGGIAHDFNNLLGIITGFSDIIRHDLNKADPMCADVEEITRAAKQASGLTRQLLAFSRKQVMQPRVFDLNGIVREMEKMLGRLIGEDIELFLNLSPQVTPVESDPVLVEQVIMNLAVNARDAMPEGGKLVIETGTEDLDAERARALEASRPGPHVVLSVTDSGQGMDEATRSRIFEPFYTTKEVGKGTGLGLSTVYGIVKQSAGTVRVESRPGVGTTFRVYLPKSEDRLTEVPDAEAASLRGTETVLVVEDEEMLLSLISRMLKMSGYNVLEARHGGEALLLCERHEGDIHLLLTDVVMPQMSGRELSERLAPLRPGMRILFMSGYTDDAIIRHGILERGIPFVQKPFSAHTLAARVREALEGR